MGVEMFGGDGVGVLVEAEGDQIADSREGAKEDAKSVKNTWFIITGT